MSTGAVIKYRTVRILARIEPIEIVRETEASIFTARNGGSERRTAKVSSYEEYHDTWSDAHAHLLAQAESAIEGARLALERAKGNLGNIKGMKPPAGGAK